jgi:hypothetical protein
LVNIFRIGRTVFTEDGRGKILKNDVVFCKKILKNDADAVKSMFQYFG